MSKVKNLDLSKKIKELLAMVSAGVITLASTGCGFEGKKNDDVAANSPIGYIDEQTLPANETTLSSASTSVETTTTLKPFDKNSGRIKHFDNGTSVVSDYVETSYEDELTTTGTTYTTVKGTNVVSEKNNDDTTKLVVENSKPVTTKSSTTVKITTKPTTKTSVDTTKATTKPTTAKTTEKTTKPTTKPTTAKTTTTVTTTTTEAVTEPPVQQDYNINDICYNADAFRYFGDKLVNELKTNSNGVYYDLINLNGNYTDMYVQGYSLLALLNYGAISDEVIASVFSEFNVDQISSCVDFLILIGDINFNLNKKINYENYSCDSCKDIAQYANVIEDNYFNNNMEEFISYEIDAGNIEQRYRDSLAIKCLLGGYGNGYLFSPEFDDCLYDFSDYLSSVALGKSLKY